jgi:hypothetical protein
MGAGLVLGAAVLSTAARVEAACRRPPPVQPRFHEVHVRDPDHTLTPGDCAYFEAAIAAGLDSIRFSDPGRLPRLDDQEVSGRLARDGAGHVRFTAGLHSGYVASPYGANLVLPETLDRTKLDAAACSAAEQLAGLVDDLEVPSSADVHVLQLAPIVAGARRFVGALQLSGGVALSRDFLGGAQVALFDNRTDAFAGLVQIAGRENTAYVFQGVLQLSVVQNRSGRGFAVVRGASVNETPDMGPFDVVFDLALLNQSFNAGLLEGVAIAAMNVSESAQHTLLALGAVNFTRGSFDGAVELGLINVIQGAFRGALQAAVLDDVAGDFTGVQLGLVNRVGGSVRGVQVGLVNWADAVRGAQLGAFNRTACLRGVQVGLFNLSGDGGLPASFGLNAGF